jgi:uncharacterized protein involved in response to NO
VFLSESLAATAGEPGLAMPREQGGSCSAPPAAKRPVVAAVSERYLVFLATSLFLGLGLGFVLAILLPLAQALRAHWGLRWESLAQVHGHVQVVGFAGFFIIGMGYRLIPRFSGTPLRHAWTVIPVYSLLLVGILLRALSQPLDDDVWLHWGPAIAAVCEFVGASLFGLTVLDTLRRPLRNRQVWAAFMAAGAVWFVVQAAFGAWFLTDLSFGGGLAGLPAGQTVLTEGRDRLLLTVQVYGFLLGFLLGVAIRAVPTFFGHRPHRYLSLAAWALLQAGIVLFSGEALLTVWHGEGVVWLQSAGLLCLGVALLAVAATTGSWKSPSRLRPTARPVAGFLSAAFLWCALAGTLDCGFALRGWVTTHALPTTQADAVRHLLTVGVVTTLIVGMAHLVVPALATRRLTGSSTRRRLVFLQVCLAVAVLFRVVPPLVPDIDARVRDSLLGTAGSVAWLALALFALILWSARRQQANLIELVTQTSPTG